MNLNTFKIKSIIVVSILTLVSLYSYAQSPIGAWERYYNDENGNSIVSIFILSEKFQSMAMYNTKSGEFIYSKGGYWELNDNLMTVKVEFDTANSERVGELLTFEVKITNNILSLPDSNWHFSKIDNGTPGELNGAWLMSGRYRNGVKQTRSTERPRKTMKILSGTRFQWIAFDTDKKEFKGTGGGTYTTIDGKYTEKIEFFSRDNSRVGMYLEFNYNIDDGNWIHKGKTSKGDPLHEIWEKRKK